MRNARISISFVLLVLRFGNNDRSEKRGGQEEARKRHEARGSRLESYSVTFLSYSCFLLAA